MLSPAATFSAYQEVFGKYYTTGPELSHQASLVNDMEQLAYQGLAARDPITGLYYLTETLYFSPEILRQLAAEKEVDAEPSTLSADRPAWLLRHPEVVQREAVAAIAAKAYIPNTNGWTAKSVPSTPQVVYDYSTVIDPDLRAAMGSRPGDAIYVPPSGKSLPAPGDGLRAAPAGDVVVAPDGGSTATILPGVPDVVARLAARSPIVFYGGVALVLWFVFFRGK